AAEPSTLRRRAVARGPPPLSRRIARSRTRIIIWPYYTRFVGRSLAALALLALLLPAPARAQGPVIVALGDSLTAGLGVAAEEAYPALLEARLAREGLRYRVVNAGVSGDTTAGALLRLDRGLR